MKDSKKVCFIEWKVNTVKYREFILNGGYHLFYKLNKVDHEWNLISYETFNKEVVAVTIENSKLFDSSKRVSHKLIREAQNETR